MKAISIWQPWASAIAIGAKRIETRSRATKYRGTIAIHASKRCIKDELIHHGACWNWCGALRPLGVRMGGGRSLWSLLPFGAIVATAELVDCRPAGDFTLDELMTPRMPDGETIELYQWNEWMLGDYTLGRFGWLLDNVRQLQEPVPWSGSQGWFEVPDNLLKVAA